ncbi:MAG: transporter associated domain-containing protein [Pseudomonadota bacterium]
MSDDPGDSSQRSLMDRIVQAFGGEPRDQSEVLEILRDAARRSLVDTDAMAMIEGVFQVADMQVRDIMIPRAQMVVIEAEDPFDEILSTIVQSGHSRFPMIGENKDEVLGVLLAKDFLRFTLMDKSDLPDVRSLARSAVFTPESKRLNVLLKEFRTNRNHMAIVVDEYGGVAGLVTIEDVLEQIVGEIDDEHDAEEDVNVRETAKGVFTIRALMPIDEFNEFFKESFSDEEYDTIGGLVMHHAGHMPRPGEIVSVHEREFKVLAGDSRRIHLLQLST